MQGRDCTCAGEGTCGACTIDEWASLSLCRECVRDIAACVCSWCVYHGDFEYPPCDIAIQSSDR